MEQRIIIFLVLSLTIILGYDFLLKEFGLLPEPVPVEEQQFQQPDGQASSREFVAHGSSESIETFGETSGIISSTETLEEVETSLYRTSISNRGAQIRSWKLTQYLTQETDDPEPIDFFYPEGHFASPLSVQVSDPRAFIASNCLGPA